MRGWWSRGLLPVEIVSWVSCNSMFLRCLASLIGHDAGLQWLQHMLNTNLKLDQDAACDWLALRVHFTPLPQAIQIVVQHTCAQLWGVNLRP